MGSLIIKEVVKELLTKGLGKAKVLLLAGSRSVHQKPVFCFVFHFSFILQFLPLNALFLSPARVVQASC